MVKKKYYLSFLVVSLLLGGCRESSKMDDKKQLIQSNSEFVHVDLDGDNIEESVSLTIKDKSIVLKVDNQTVSLPREVMITEDPHHVYELPLIHLLNDKKARRKQMLLSVVWNTNKIGTQAELWLYKYEDKELVEVWDNEQTHEGIAYKLCSYNDGNVNLEIPTFSLNKRIAINKDYYEAILSSQLEGKIDEIASTMYAINDFNNDEIPEVVIEKRLSTGAIEWLPFKSVFEVYTLRDGTLNLIRVVPNEDPGKDILSQGISLDSGTRISDSTR